MDALAQQLADISKRLNTTTQPTFEDFSAGIEAARPLVQDFYDVAAAAADFNAGSVPRLYRGFEGILGLYDSSAPGSRWTTSCDIAKFVGHELLLVFVSSMIRSEKWDTLGNALGQSLFAYYLGEGRPLNYSYLLAEIALIRGFEPSQRWISGHGEMLKRRYESGMPVSFVDLISADYLVYIVTGFGTRGGSYWSPVTASYMNRTPDWLARCQSSAHLKGMLGLFGVADVENFRQRFAKVRLPNFPTAFRLDYSLLKPEGLAACP
jgi:hypothetical protein